MKTIYLYVEENGRVQWGSSPAEGAIEIEVEEDHPVLHSPGRYLYIDGELIEDLVFVIADMKKQKDRDFNEACHLTIVAGFKFDIRGERYHFSYDTEAQLNIQGAREMLRDGLVDYVYFTATNSIGIYVRIPLTKIEVDGLAVEALRHKDRVTNYYRGTLTDLLIQASTIEEIESITWDYESYM